MKMAKASKADLDMAMELANSLESLERWSAFPTALRPDATDPAVFDIDEHEHCKEALEYLLKLVRSASLMRVVSGMAVLLDPRNKMVDPDADALEHHPNDAKVIATLRKARATVNATASPQHAEWAAELDAAIGLLDNKGGLT